MRSVAVVTILLATACVPYVTKDYKMSAQHWSVAHSCGMEWLPMLQILAATKRSESNAASAAGLKLLRAR